MSTDELQRLHQRLDGLNQILMEVRDATLGVTQSMAHQQRSCDERMAVSYKEIEQVSHAVFGNSREGLEDRVKGLETTVRSVIVDRGRMALGTGSISVKVLAAILGAVSALIGGVLASIPAIIEAIR